MMQLVPYVELKAFGNIPIDTGVLQSLYSSYQSPNMRIALLEKKGILILGLAGQTPLDGIQ